MSRPNDMACRRAGRGKTSNDGWLRTAQRVDRKDPRAESLAQSAPLPAGGKPSISRSYPNGNASGQSNQLPECERRGQAMTFHYDSPWRHHTPAKTHGSKSRSDLTVRDCVADGLSSVRSALFLGES